MSWNCRECGAFEGQLHVRGCPLADAEGRTRLVDVPFGMATPPPVCCVGCGKTARELPAVSPGLWKIPGHPAWFCRRCADALAREGSVHVICQECGSRGGHPADCLTGHAAKFGAVNASKADCSSCKMPWPTHSDACPRRSPRPGAVVDADFDPDHAVDAVAYGMGWTSPVFRVAQHRYESVDFTGPMRAAVAAGVSVKHSDDASPLLKHVPRCGFKDCTRPSCPESTTDYGLLCPRGYCAIHYEQWKMAERPIEHGPYGGVRDAPGKTLENYLAQRINKLAVDDMSEPP